MDAEHKKEVLIAAISEDLIVDLTAKLVAIPTPNPPGQEKPLAEFIVATMQGWGLEVELVPHPDPERPQVVAWLRGTGNGPTLILNAHMDTVGAGEQAAWQFPRFR
jgi:succinyl-diaminopimelate desuccinylase